MNRVYKIVWSKAKNAYVVTSELAKNHTKNASGKMVKTALTAAVDQPGRRQGPRHCPWRHGPGQIALGRHQDRSEGDQPHHSRHHRRAAGFLA